MVTPKLPETADQAPSSPHTLRSRSEILSCTVAELPALRRTLAKSRSCCGGSPCKAQSHQEPRLGLSLGRAAHR
jgi:hypothetical protein